MSRDEKEIRWSRAVVKVFFVECWVAWLVFLCYVALFVAIGIGASGPAAQLSAEEKKTKTLEQRPYNSSQAQHSKEK